MPRFRLPALLVGALVLAACQVPFSAEAPPGGRPDTVTETESTTCSHPGPAISTLCEAIDLIEGRYIDRIDPLEATAAANDGLGRLEPVDEPPLISCGTTDLTIDQLCRSIDGADVDLEAGVEASLEMIAFELLDPYSAYLDADALAESVSQTTGTVEGIGALVTTEDTTAADPRRSECSPLSDECHLIIVSVFPGGPAELGGVASDDRVLTVDGVDVDGMTIDEVTGIVRGPSGSPVALGMSRDGSNFDTTLVRASVDIPVVTAATVEDVGYLRLSIFTNASRAQVREALSDFIAAGITTLVVDLRDNPGGTLESAVDITSEFLGDGVVVRTQSPENEVPYEVTGGGIATGDALEVIILVNGGSASASEVMAGALSEAGRATLIGEPTFGKNTVQQRFGLDNGGAIKLTVARWITPGGVDFGASGITPDITADLAPDLTPEELVAEINRLVG